MCPFSRIYLDRWGISISLSTRSYAYGGWFKLVRMGRATARAPYPRPRAHVMSPLFFHAGVSYSEKFYRISGRAVCACQNFVKKNSPTWRFVSVPVWWVHVHLSLHMIYYRYLKFERMADATIVLCDILLRFNRLMKKVLIFSSYGTAVA